MANRQERHQRKKEMKTPRVRKKSPRGKLAKSTKISLSILAVMLLMVVAGTIFFFQKYGKEVTAAIDAGEEHAASIQESDFKQYHPTTVLDKNGQVIKELKTQERDYLTYDKMDPLVSQALIAIEDKRFYEHHGVDTQGLLTIAINAATGRGIRGASTITQQLVKNIYLTPEVSISRKIEEMVMAQSLEKKFTKHQILEYYLNNVYFGHGAYGINAAAKVYFGKSINDTSLLEKAVLVGITNNPGIFDPTDNKKNGHVGDIVVFAPGQMGADSYYGHVAIVEGVNADGSIKISESNDIRWCQIMSHQDNFARNM